MSNNAGSVKHVTAVLNMPPKIGDKIIKAKYVEQKMTGNSDFPVPYPSNVCSLAQYGTDLGALDTAESAAQSKTKGAVALRDAAMLTVTNDLKTIMAMVQTAANADPANAEPIIKNAGFDVKATTVKQKQGNTATANDVPGIVDLTADGSGPHEWQMSKDQIAIVALHPTLKASNIVTGLNTGDVWYFRNRKIGKAAGQYNWCPWIKVKVN